MTSRDMGRILREKYRVATKGCFSEDRRERTGAGMAPILPDPVAPVKRPTPGARAFLRCGDAHRLGLVAARSPPGSPPGHGTGQPCQDPPTDHGGSPGMGSRREQEGIVLGTLQPRRNVSA